MVWSQKSHKLGRNEGCTAAASFTDQEWPFLNIPCSGRKGGLLTALAGIHLSFGLECHWGLQTFQTASVSPSPIYSFPQPDL